MREIMIALATIGLFCFAFFVAARIGGFLEVNYRGADTAKRESRTVPILFSSGNNPAETAEQIRNLGDDYGQCAVIVCGAEGPDLRDYIDPELGEYLYQIG